RGGLWAVPRLDGDRGVRDEGGRWRWWVGRRVGDRVWFSPDGRYMALWRVGDDFEVYSWRGEGVLRLSRLRVEHVVFSPDSERLAVLHIRRYLPKLTLYSLASGRCLGEFSLFSSHRHFGFVGRDWFYFLDGANQLVVWDCGLREYVGRVMGIDLLFWAVSLRHSLFLYRSKGGYFLYHPLYGERRLGVEGVRFAVFGRGYLFLSFGSYFRVYRLDSLAEVGEFRYFTEADVACFLEDGSGVVVFFRDGVGLVWRFGELGGR
ncbi:MAG: hypothetical protein D6805_05280, partial [Planctomycetota bacterium]